MVLTLARLQTRHRPDNQLTTIVEGFDGIARIDTALKGQPQRQHVAHLKIVNAHQRIEVRCQGVIDDVTGEYRHRGVRCGGLGQSDLGWQVVIDPSGRTHMVVVDVVCGVSGLDLVVDYRTIRGASAIHFECQQISARTSASGNIRNRACERGLVPAQRPGLAGIGISKVSRNDIRQGHPAGCIEVAAVLDPDLIGDVIAVTHMILIRVLQHLVCDEVHDAVHVNHSLGYRLRRRRHIGGREGRNIVCGAGGGVVVYVDPVGQATLLSDLDAPERPGQGVVNAVIGRTAITTRHWRDRIREVIDHLSGGRCCTTGILVSQADMYAVTRARIVLIALFDQIEIRLGYDRNVGDVAVSRTPGPGDGGLIIEIDVPQRGVDLTAHCHYRARAGCQRADIPSGSACVGIPAMAVTALKRRCTNDFRGDDIANHDITCVTKTHVFVTYLVGRNRARR